MRSQRRPKEPPSERRRRSWPRILATCSLLFLLTPALASTQSALPPLAEPSIKHGPEAKLIQLTEQELEEIIKGALDDAIPRAVQAAVAPERAARVEAETERDDYKQLWLEERAATRRKMLPWQLATGTSTLLALLALLALIF